MKIRSLILPGIALLALCFLTLGQKSGAGQVARSGHPIHSQWTNYPPLLTGSLTVLSEYYEHPETDPDYTHEEGSLLTVDPITLRLSFADPDGSATYVLEPGSAHFSVSGTRLPYPGARQTRLPNPENILCSQGFTSYRQFLERPDSFEAATLQLSATDANSNWVSYGRTGFMEEWGQNCDGTQWGPRREDTWLEIEGPITVRQQDPLVLDIFYEVGRSIGGNGYSIYRVTGQLHAVGRDPNLRIEGIPDAEEESVGGVVVLNEAEIPAEEQVPRLKVTLEGIAAQSSGKVLLETSSNSVKVYAQPEGGAPLRFNGRDNRFSVSSLPKQFWLEGARASRKMRDVELTATFQGGAPSTQARGAPSDKARFTVLWAEQPEVKFAGRVSMRNAARAWYQEITSPSTTKLGFPIFHTAGPITGVLSVGYGYEVSARVHPRRFDHPYTQAFLTREVRGLSWYDDGFSQTSFNPTNGLDRSPEVARDDNPRPNGIIDDLDGPGLAMIPLTQGIRVRRRWNFVEYAMVRIGGREFRCSLPVEIFVRFSMEQIAPGQGTTYTRNNDIPGDNTAGLGTTLLSWNLQ